VDDPRFPIRLVEAITTETFMPAFFTGESVSYQGLVAAVREELARHYLTRTELSNAEISFLLGFEDPNSFFRAFRDWTGATPEATRRDARS